MDTIFTVREEELGRLSPEEAVEFFHDLLLADANTLGIGKNLINVPSAITVADGGIDAEVRDVSVCGGQGIIDQGLNRYQIKTGTFSPSEDRHIREILFKDGSTELKTRVKTCLDKGGRLIIVLFGWDNPDTTDNQVAEKFREKLSSIDKTYSNANIEVWRQNVIIGFLKPYPSLVLQLKGIGDLPFDTHKSWSQNGDMGEPLVASPDYYKKAESIQEALRSTDQARHIRIIAEAGAGKTRFVLEATGTQDIAPLVVYTKADAFIRSSLLTYIRRDDNTFRVIVVVDECSQQQRIELWNLLRNRGSRIKLITIYNEIEIMDSGIDYPAIPKLSADEIKQIIATHGVPGDQVNRWAQLAGNSPRFAHMIGTNLHNYPDDVLREVEGIYDRIIAGYEDPNSEEARKRRLVLRCVALFKRFGYKGPFEQEARIVAGIVERLDRNITLGKFQDIIRTLQSRFMLQGETTLYITPIGFHIRMWNEWWNEYGNLHSFEELLKEVSQSPQLRDWFYQMFKYADGSDAASGVVKNLLGKHGLFQDED